MPVYSYKCLKCGELTDHVVKYVNRSIKQDCPDCGAEGSAEYVISAPMIKGEVKKGDKRLIFDECQVTDEYGKNWRDGGTTRNPGGAGKKLFFHD